jgi:hypothetical protein
VFADYRGKPDFLLFHGPMLLALFAFLLLLLVFILVKINYTADRRNRLSHNLHQVKADRFRARQRILALYHTGGITGLVN